MSNKIEIIILLLLVNYTLPAVCQVKKPALDVEMLGKWPSIENARLSNDGKYSLYFIHHPDAGIRDLHIGANFANWQFDVANAASAEFSPDSRRVFFTTSSDSLGIIDVVAREIKYIPNVRSFLTPEEDSGQCIAYLSDKPGNTLVLLNLDLRTEKKFTHVVGYHFSPNGEHLLVQRLIDADSTHMQVLEWIDLSEGESRQIWQGLNVGRISFDDSNKKVAFIAMEHFNQKSINCLYWYSDSMNHAVKASLASDAISANGFSLVNRMPLFSRSGKRILFELQQIIEKGASAKYSNVDIWNYRDLHLPSARPERATIWAVVNIDNGKIVPITKPGEELVPVLSFGNYLLAVNDHSTREVFEHGYIRTINLVSTINGDRKLIVDHGNTEGWVLSPDDHFVVWFGTTELNYFSYEIHSGIKRNISTFIKSPLYDVDEYKNGRILPGLGVCGWDIQNESIYVRDKFDIWEVGLAGNELPINVTHGYGRRHQIVFDLINRSTWLGFDNLTYRGALLLMGFNLSNKMNGFWGVRMSSDPSELTMDPAAYYVSRTGAIGNIGRPDCMRPIKARDADVFLISRMGSTEYPNLYLTTDFKELKEISHLHPEKTYNWLTAELLKWPMMDGKMSAGILYKPENFDPLQKYPIIFEYYEKRSDELNKYIFPDFSFARINVAFFVSNGYLVFVPDIYYKQGHNGNGVVNAVVSAANFLSHFSWIDSTKMGLQGHSFAGWETNFLVTHSALFAAACAASGVSDQISAYDEIQHDGGDRQAFYEFDQQGGPYGFGVTPWTEPQLYIENSPIFGAGKVTTPLLLMHGDADDAVPYSQGTEMFLALQRAGKKVWLLQYENAGHILEEDDARDYTIRMKQFFDYYLKDSLPPKWMTEGVPRQLKGIETGLDLDASGKQP